MIKRDWHWTDSPTAEPGKRTRVIRNWVNYKDTVGTWRETNPRVRHAEPGDEFIGRQLDWVATSQPLQFFVGDSAAAGGRPWWGVRRSEDNDTGVAIFLENGDANAGYTVDAQARSLTWQDVLPDTDLILYVDDHRVEKWLALLTSTSGEGGTGDRAVLGFVLPTGWTLDVIDSGAAGNRISIKRANGVEVYRSRPARAYDSAPEPQPVPCAFIAPTPATATLGGVTYWRVRVRCSPAGFTRPVLMDPDVTVSGTTDIEDASISNATGAYATYNFGGFTYNWAGSYPAQYWCLYRLATSAIPTGTITAFSHRIFKAGYTAQSANVRYVALDTGNDWVEGTGTGVATQAGSCCFNFAKYDTQAWTGGVITTAVRAEASYSELDTFPDAAGAGEYVMSLKTHWAQNWKSGTWENNGMLLKELVNRATSLGYSHYQTENATAGNRPYFTITYTQPAADLSYHVIDPSGIDGANDMAIDPRGR